METRRSKLRAQVEALNEQYAAWVKTELEEHRLELWIDGTKQYISHAEKLLEEFKEAEKGSVNSGDARTASSGQVLLNGLAKENGPSKEENPFKATTTPSVPFGWNKEQSSPSKPPVPAFLQQNNFSFGQSKAAAPFSFGQATHSKGENRKGLDEEPVETSTKPEEAAKKPSLDFKFPSTSAPFSFGSSAAAPAFTGFGSNSSAPSFTGFNSFSSLSKEGEDGAKDEDNADEPQEEENRDPIARQDDASAEIVFETKANLFIQPTEGTDKAWANKGKGTLTLRKPKEKPGRPFIVFASDTGQILLNASVHQGLKALEKEKNKILMTLFWAEKGSMDAKGFLVVVKLQSPEIMKDFSSQISILAA